MKTVRARKKKPESKEVQRLRAMFLKIDSTKQKISDLRDKLRNQVSDVEDILETLDLGIEAFDSGKREFDDGLDYLSQHL